mgnify:CR=1 FL=1
MNKVREGYKMTEIGEIPEEWEVSEIGRYIENISKKNKDLNIQHVVSVTKYNGIVDSLEYFDKQVFSKDISNYKIIKKDEFAYSTIHLNEGAIGYLKHCENAVLSPMYTVFKVRNDLVNNYFLYNLLKSNKYINIYEMLGEGSVDRRSSIPFNKFKEIKVAMPPIEEQEKISSILSTVDEQIDNIDALIEKNKELKKGLMQTLLTKGIGHIKFKKTEIGEIPDEWEVKKIIDIATTTSGGTPSRAKKEYYENGIYPWVKTGELYNKYISETEEYITEDALKKSSAKLVQEGAVIIAMYGATIGKLSIAKRSVTTNQACCSIICNDNICYNEYLYYRLDFEKENIINLGAGGAQPNISQDIIKSYKLAIPSIVEQQRIALILSEIDEKIDEYENKKQKLEELKKGLMQQLLTGKIRVI